MWSGSGLSLPLAARYMGPASGTCHGACHSHPRGTRIAASTKGAGDSVTDPMNTTTPPPPPKAGAAYRPQRRDCHRRRHPQAQAVRGALRHRPAHGPRGGGGPGLRACGTPPPPPPPPPTARRGHDSWGTALEGGCRDTAVEGRCGGEGHCRVPLHRPCSGGGGGMGCSTSTALRGVGGVPVQMRCLTTGGSGTHPVARGGGGSAWGRRPPPFQW